MHLSDHISQWYDFYTLTHDRENQAQQPGQTPSGNSPESKDIHYS